MTIKHTAIYARLATDPTGNNLPQQIAALHEYAADHGYEIIQVYQDVGSGLRDDRPGLQRLLTDARAGRFDVVVMRDPTRLSRNWTLFQRDYTLLREELGIDVIFTVQDDMD
jgi:site-specific DNA recombinase